MKPPRQRLLTSYTDTSGGCCDGPHATRKTTLAPRPGGTLFGLPVLYGRIAWITTLLSAPIRRVANSALQWMCTTIRFPATLLGRDRHLLHDRSGWERVRPRIRLLVPVVSNADLHRRALHRVLGNMQMAKMGRTLDEGDLVDRDPDSGYYYCSPVPTWSCDDEVFCNGPDWCSGGTLAAPTVGIPATVIFLMPIALIAAMRHRTIAAIRSLTDRRATTASTATEADTCNSSGSCSNHSGDPCNCNLPDADCTDCCKRVSEQLHGAGTERFGVRRRPVLQRNGHVQQQRQLQQSLWRPVQLQSS